MPFHLVLFDESAEAIQSSWRATAHPEVGSAASSPTPNFRLADHTLGGNGTTSTHSPDAVKAPGVAVSWRLLHASGQGMSHPRKVWPP